MFVKRIAELQLLEDQYTFDGNNLVLLYGRKGTGKTTLLAEFIKNKSAVYYYEGTECEDKLQLFRMNQNMTTSSTSESVLEYPVLFSNFITSHEEKAIIILDEFQYIIRNSPNFTETLRVLSTAKRPIMFVLSSSSIRWAENDMVSDLGALAASITAYMKLKEFTFVDFVNRFPKASVETCININAILGGVPEYLDCWLENQSVRENIEKIILNKNSRLFAETQQFLRLELREPAVYNTILYALAKGNRKLNDLHAKTGFSRAKISVYLKNLIQLDLVEKLVPLNAEGKENVQKGLYRIKDNFLSFWYRFVFDNTSQLMLGKVSQVYEEKIAPNLEEYMSEYFADVCTEYLKLMNQYDRLPEKILWWDRWYGKNGTIDINAQGDKDKKLIGKCLWNERKMEMKDYETLISLAGEAKISPDFTYFFSKKGFSQELAELAKDNKNIVLVGLDDL